jgi:hypothetical protein
MSRALLAALALVVGSCVGTAGGELGTFRAYASGPSDAVSGQPYSFVSGRGYSVTLTRARLHVGALYLNRSQQTSVDSDTSCTLPGIYSAELTHELDVDVLSPDLQEFPALGQATSDRARTAEVWLTSGDINDVTNTGVVLDVAGSAEKNGEIFPFEGTITIGENRVVPPTNPAQPGAKPICKQRIVTPIPVDLKRRDGESLVLTIDPRGLFGNVEFSLLEPVSTNPPLYRFHDSSDDQPSANLFNGLRSSVGVYSFVWQSVSNP